MADERRAPARSRRAGAGAEARYEFVAYYTRADVEAPGERERRARDDAELARLAVRLDALTSDAALARLAELTAGRAHYALHYERAWPRAGNELEFAYRRPIVRPSAEGGQDDADDNPYVFPWPLDEEVRVFARDTHRLLLVGIVSARDDGTLYARARPPARGRLLLRDAQPAAAAAALRARDAARSVPPAPR